MLINPQNEFCSYENSAFQGKKHPRRQKSIAVEDFNSPSRLCPKDNKLHNHRSRFVSKDNKRICMKGNNFHNRRSPTCGQRHHYTPLPERQNFFVSIISTSVKKEPMELKFVIGNSHFSFLHFSFLHFSFLHFSFLISHFSLLTSPLLL